MPGCDLEAIFFIQLSFPWDLSPKSGASKVEMSCVDVMCYKYYNCLICVCVYMDV